MNDSSLLTKAGMLRREIEQIQQDERIYRGMKHHTRADIMAHASRELRLVEINRELERLQNRGKP